MLALPLLILAQARSEPKMTGLEAATAKKLEAVGGTTAWVQEDDWQLCLDLTNTAPNLDLRPVTGLTRLYALRVFKGGINESTLRSLAQLKNLHLLVILSNGLTNKGMAHIGKLEHLDKLDVKSDTVDKAGLEHLDRLKNLKRLYLYNTKIGDSDLGPLAKLGQLTVLDLPATVSDKAVQKLRLALPDTNVAKIE